MYKGFTVVKLADTGKPVPSSETLSDTDVLFTSAVKGKGFVATAKSAARAYLEKFV